MSERDTHFQGSAKRLWQRLHAEIEYGPNNGNLAMQKAALEQIIARHDYDLAWHIFASVPASLQAELGDPDNCVKAVPDFNKTVPDFPERFNAE